MTDNQIDTQKTVEELITDILEDEAQIVHCLREFFCKTLQEISVEHHLCPDKKVESAEDLICAAAKKETALAAVLDAISKIIEEEPVVWISLTPGQVYQITSPGATVRTITFIAKTDVGVSGGRISAIVSGDDVGGPTNINEIPTQYSIDLGGQAPPNLVTLQNTGTVTVYIRNVIAS